MILLTLLLAAAGVTPPEEESGGKVSGLVSLLDDDAIEMREKATEELLRIGKPAIPDLILSRDTTRSEEVRARIKSILSKLEESRPRASQEGAPLGGLSLALRVQAGDSTGLLMEAEFTNVSPEPRQFFPVRLLNMQVPAEGFVSNLSEGTLEVKPTSPDAPRAPKKWRRLCAAGPNRRTAILLKPAERFRSEFWLDLRSLPPGEYSVQLEYFSRGLLDTAENLKSNVLTVTLDP